MAIGFPTTVTPETQDFGIKYLTQVSATSLTNIVQTVELPGARWHGTMSFRDLNPVQSAELKAFLLTLRGSSGRFAYGDLDLTAPQDSTMVSPGAGVLTIQGTSTRRNIIINAPANGSFSVGDRIQIGDDDNMEYKMIVKVNSSTDYLIEPMIRRADYIGQEIFYIAPKGIFMLDSDDYAKWSLRSKAKLSDISFSFVEAFT